MDNLLSIVGWDNLLTVARPRASAFEFVANVIFILGAGIMVAQAVSLGH
jgi:hypothetical protein